jgi:hypothetical protein
MPRSFTRTAAALAAYDAAGEAMDVAVTDAECVAAVEAWDRGLRLVAEAFADDTADINDRALVLSGFQHNGADLKFARRMASKD